VGHYEINPLKITKWGHFKDSRVDFIMSRHIYSTGTGTLIVIISPVFLNKSSLEVKTLNIYFLKLFS
jgi:hypothetical protein